MRMNLNKTTHCPKKVTFPAHNRCSIAALNDVVNNDVEDQM